MTDIKPTVGYEVRERIAVLTLNNPPVNAMSLAHLASLHGAVDRAMADEQARVVVLTGAGRTFCAGANIQELHDLEGSAGARELSARGQALCQSLEDSPKPVIAALNGKYVLGGGAEIAMACHLRVCERSTQIGSPEVLLGLMVGWGASQRMPRLIGLGRALDLLLTGRRVGADEALRMGLVNRVVEDGDALATALEMAQSLVALGPASLAATLSAALAGVRGHDGMAVEQSLFAGLCDGPDWREGTDAFLNKRKPQFTND